MRRTIPGLSDFTVRWAMVAAFLLSMNGCGGGSGGGASAPDTTPNRAPAAQAGPDQQVRDGALVTLDGSASSDPDGAIVGYRWTQASGTSVVLSTANASVTRFTAPNRSVLLGAEVLEFRLTVTDDRGAASTDTVTITVVPENDHPIADAGGYDTVATGFNAPLDGTASRDPDGAIVSYQWEQIAGPPVDLSGAESVVARYVAPATAATLRFQLRVTDDEGASHTDTLDVDVFAGATLQAELGPVVGASVEMYDATRLDEAPLFSTTTRDDPDVGHAGAFFVPAPLLAPSETYLFIVAGGVDVDSNDDGHRDTPVPVAGRLRAIYTEQDLRTQPVSRINALTTAATMLSRYMLASEYSTTEIHGNLHYLAQTLLRRDQDSSGRIDRSDLAAFRPSRTTTDVWRAAQVFGLRDALLTGTHAHDVTPLRETFIEIDEFGGRGIATDGSFAFIADGDIRILDLTDRAAPVLIGTIRTPGEATDVYLDGSTLYIADQIDGLHLWDVTNPRAPQQLGTFDTPGVAGKVVVMGSRAFVADLSHGVHEIDVTDATQPALVQTVWQPGMWARDIAVDGSRLAIADATSGLVFADLSVFPAAIVTIPLPGPNVVAIRNDLVVTVVNPRNGDPNELRTFNVADVSNPAQIGTLPIQNVIVNALLLRDDSVFAATTHYGVLSFDIANPESPTAGAAHRSRTPNEIRDLVSLDSSILGVAESRPGILELLPVSDPDPRIVGIARVPLLGTSVRRPIAMAPDDSLIAVQYSGGVLIYGLSDPRHPRLESSIMVVGGVDDLVIGNGVLYVTGSEGLSVFDIRDPRAPVEMTNIGGSGRALALVGDRLIHCEDGNTVLLNVSTPGNPVELGRLEIAHPSAVAALSNTVYVGHSQGVDVIDVIEPELPVRVRTLPLGNVRSVAIGNGRLAVTLHNQQVLPSEDRVHLFDVATPAMPLPLSSRPGSVAHSVLVGDLWIQARVRDGFVVEDLTDPENPQVIDLVRTPESAVHVAVGRDFVALGDAAIGPYVIRAPKRAANAGVLAW